MDSIMDKTVDIWDSGQESGHYGQSLDTIQDKAFQSFNQVDKLSITYQNMGKVQLLNSKLTNSYSRCLGVKTASFTRNLLII